VNICTDNIAGPPSSIRSSGGFLVLFTIFRKAAEDGSALLREVWEAGESREVNLIGVRSGMPLICYLELYVLLAKSISRQEIAQILDF
jgi:hypothetical protein